MSGIIMPDRTHLKGAARKSALKRDALDYLRTIAKTQRAYGLR